MRQGIQLHGSLLCGKGSCDTPRHSPNLAVPCRANTARALGPPHALSLPAPAPVHGCMHAEASMLARFVARSFNAPPKHAVPLSIANPSTPAAAAAAAQRRTVMAGVGGMSCVLSGQAGSVPAGGSRQPSDRMALRPVDAACMGGGPRRGMVGYAVSQTGTIETLPVYSTREHGCPQLVHVVLARPSAQGAGHTVAGRAPWTCRIPGTAARRTVTDRGWCLRDGHPADAEAANAGAAARLELQREAGGGGGHHGGCHVHAQAAARALRLRSHLHTTAARHALGDTVMTSCIASLGSNGFGASWLLCSWYRRLTCCSEV